MRARTPALPGSTLGQASPTSLATNPLGDFHHHAEFAAGNNRVGAVAADVFLVTNGWRLTATQDDYAELVLSVARGKTSKSAIAEFFREHTQVI